MSDKWKSDEIEMLMGDMTNEEIVRVTGRTMTAVRKKRYLITGHYVEVGENHMDWRLKRSPASFESQTTKVGRLIALAKKLGVKLLGKE